jgi:hypothetical protein
MPNADDTTSASWRHAAAWTPPARKDDRGRKLHVDHVLQANEGCDLGLPARPLEGRLGRRDLSLTSEG